MSVFQICILGLLLLPLTVTLWMKWRAVPTGAAGEGARQTTEAWFTQPGSRIVYTHQHDNDNDTWPRSQVGVFDDPANAELAVIAVAEYRARRTATRDATPLQDPHDSRKVS